LYKILFLNKNCDYILKILSECNFEFAVLGDIDNIAEKLEQIISKYDVILIDIDIFNRVGYEVINNIRNSYSGRLMPIMLTIKNSTEEEIVQALQSGIDGYITSSEGPEIVNAKIDALFRRIDWAKKQVNPPEKDILTNREKEVIMLIAEGFSNKKIAERLYLSELTVKSHLKNIFKKLNVANRTQAILTAIKRGIIEKNT